ncbi:hypothetical protein BHM03_00045951 [Ensete ventricosum]|uniref:Uncharacterized protein n=1 Tax=Ensete ventricosum TaxID=4639 RepID=A0A445MKV1_ENSVE|nr:hypothetical protein BHM03_00045951 [Ensete ventricosum]
MWQSDAGVVVDGYGRRLEMVAPGKGRRGVEDATVAAEGSTVVGEAKVVNMIEEGMATWVAGLKLEIKGEVKERQPRTVTATISFARRQEEWLNQDARRMRITPRPMTYKSPSAPSHPLLPKKLTKEELRDRSVKGLCWHYDEPWIRDHRYRKDRLLLIEPLKDVEEEV